MVKKILKIVGIVLIILIVAAFTIPYLFKDQIKAKISQTINESVDAKVSFNEADLSLFKNFPNANISIQKLNNYQQSSFRRRHLSSYGRIEFKNVFNGAFQ